MNSRLSQSYESLSSNEEGEHEGNNVKSDYSVISSVLGDQTVGRILLFTVSFLYGTLNVSLRFVYATDNPPSASALSTIRGWLAVLCFIPFLIQNHRRRRPQQQQQQQSCENDDQPELELSSTLTQQSTGTSSNYCERQLWLVSFELAFLNFATQALINTGLLFITGARAAFLTEASVVITPLVSALAGNPVKWTVWIACATALLGLVILSHNQEGLGNFGPGDLFVLAGAFSWSLYLFRLSQCGSFNEVDMQALKTLMLAFLYTLWFLFAWIFSSSASLWSGYANIWPWMLLFYSALGPGTVADVIQQKAQASIAAAEANVILAVEPVFTSILGFIFLAEAITITEFFGGGFLIAAAVLATQ